MVDKDPENDQTRNRSGNINEYKKRGSQQQTVSDQANESWPKKITPLKLHQQKVTN